MCIPKFNVLQFLISWYLQLHALSIPTHFQFLISWYLQLHALSVAAHFQHQSCYKYSVISFFWYMFMVTIQILDSSFEEY